MQARIYFREKFGYRREIFKVAVNLFVVGGILGVMAVLTSFRSSAAGPTKTSSSAPPPTEPNPGAVELSFDERRDVSLAQEGDVQAFERLYRRHLGRTYALSLRMCGNASEAEEMVQEAFIRCWSKLETFRGGSAFGSWLHRLTVNTILGRWRSAGRYRERVVALEDLSEVPHPQVQAGTGGSLDLERAIAGLPDGARTVFVLHDIEGWKHREIADQTGLAVGTCKTQLHRARSLLRKALSTTTPEVADHD